MKFIMARLIESYKDEVYRIKRRAEMTIYLYMFYLFYFVMNFIVFYEWFSENSLVIVIAFALLIYFALFYHKRLVLAQLSMLIAQILMAQIFMTHYMYFHFYGEVLLIAFYCVGTYDQVWQKYLAYLSIIALLLQRHLILSDSIFKITNGQVLYEQNVFISFSILTLIGIADYMSGVIKEEIIEKEQLEKSTYLDLLTGLYTRQKFNQDVHFWNAAIEEYEVAIIDIDFFKHINDNYGHEAGDQVLKDFTKLLNDQFKSYVNVYRWGGEEFVVINRGISSSMFDLQLDIFRRYVDENYSAEGIKFTLSIGTARTKLNEEFMDTFNRADKALYKAKEKGRNNLKREGGGYV